MLAENASTCHDHKSCPPLLPASALRSKAVGSSSPSVISLDSPRTHVAEFPVYLGGRDRLGRTALIYAVIGNSVKFLRSLLKSGVGVNDVDISGRSALHWATIKNLPECTRILLLAGTNCELQDNEGATSLHLAANHEDSKCLQIILKHVGPVPLLLDIQDNEKRTALHWSACCAHIDNFGLLYKHCNTLITLRDVAGNTVLHWLACSHRMAAVDCIRKFFVRECGAGLVNLSNYEGRTALHCAVIDGILPVVRELLLLPTINVNMKDNLESTPLHWATILGKLDVVNMLLDHGASDTAHDIDGATPWHYAVHNNSLEILNLYTSRLTNPDQRDRNGCTPLMWAASMGTNEAVNILFKFGAELRARDDQDHTALHVAAFSGKSSTIAMLLDLGASAEDVNTQKKTPLYLACEMGHVPAARTLIQCSGRSGMNRHVDGNGCTCLHCPVRCTWQAHRDSPLLNSAFDLRAASSGQINVCSLLVEHGFDPNASNFAGRSPMICAAFHGYIDCMSLLKENGGNPEHRDNDGMTALHYASKNGQFDAVKLLIDWNVNLNPIARSGERFSPLDLATVNFHYELGRFLYKKGGVSIAHIREISAVVIQAAYRGYRARKLYRISRTPRIHRLESVKLDKHPAQDESGKVAHNSSEASSTMELTLRIRKNVNGDCTDACVKRLSCSMEELLQDFAVESVELLNGTYTTPASPLRLRRKKFQNLTRSELALDCIRCSASDTGASEAVVNSRLWLQPVHERIGAASTTEDTSTAAAAEEFNTPPKSVRFTDGPPSPKSDRPLSPFSVPAWCFNPVLRRAAVQDWSEKLANLTFTRIPMKPTMCHPEK